jgi:hypothetical protein
MRLTKAQRDRLKADEAEARRIRQELKDWYQREKARISKEV